MEHLHRHLKILSEEIGSRSIQEPEKIHQAEAYIQSELESVGLQVVRQEYEAFGTKTANLIARSPEWNAKTLSLVLGAHYDTVQGTPGADDNASAVAVLIETARKVVEDSSEKIANLLFVAFSTEEPPCFNTDLMGSRIFVQRSKQMGLKIEGALVLEMVGYFRDEPGSQSLPEGIDLGIPDVGDFIALVGDEQSAGLAAKTHRACEESDVGLPFHPLVVPESAGILSSLITLSDNASFWEAGIPALMITDTAFLRNPNYHEVTDTLDTLNIIEMKKLVDALAFTLRK